MFIAFGIRYGAGSFVNGIAAAAPPGEAVAAVQLDYDPMPGLGSNAIALGSELTASGKGILFGNPHYPWHGPARFHMIHTTIPGEVDTMGASLLSGSFVAIGFNKDIAWTHTVSTALRMTLFEKDGKTFHRLRLGFFSGYSEAQKIMLNGSIVHTNFLGTGNRVALQLNSGRFQKLYSISHTDPCRTMDGVSRTIRVNYRDITQFT